MSDNTTTPVQVPPSDDKPKTQVPSNDRKAKGSDEAGKPADAKPAGD